ncbi:signal recognition particle receptor subunit alpha [Triticum urartu]|nr:signal recognition particle receptor subunit alpha [Triticum urartu]
MLEELLIFTRGGLILWSSCRALGGAALLKGSPIDALIRSCLLEERSGDAGFTKDAYALKWTFNNDLGLVFVAVYQRMLHLLYVDGLLAAVRKEFSQIYNPKRVSYDDLFTETFRQLHLEAEARAEAMNKSKQQPTNPSSGSGAGRGPAGKKLGPNARAGGGAAGKKNSGSGKDDSDGDSGKEHNGGFTANGTVAKGGQENGAIKDSSRAARAVVVDNDGKENGDPNDGAFDVNTLRKKTGGKKGGGGGKKNDVKKAAKTEPKKVVKQMRVWDDKPPKNEKLDFTDPADERGGEVIEKVLTNQGDSMMDKDEDLSSDSEDEEDEEEENAGAGQKKKGWFSSMFKSIAGNNVLEKSDLQPALKALKDRLMTKNVAEEIAEKLCESVAASLEGKKLGSFTRISSTVQTAMEEALLRILTPRRSIDILRDVQAAKERGKPYVVVFVGVNGVGKSTNLAKVAYWLLQHNLSVMMAACDTFRSGAVEQLRTHARRLEIPIFEKGYEKDPAVVAKEAIQEATRNKSDVVLVDTAGRMQDNEPLMRALSKLINLNKPDLVLFVGEALVGNDAVDQLNKFNQKLADLSTVPTARLIDGILLTKFDTIDDKVGAALSMVYISGSPVMFVGCGQSYTDLKKLNVKSIVKTLLK